MGWEEIGQRHGLEWPTRPSDGRQSAGHRRCGNRHPLVDDGRPLSKIEAILKDAAPMTATLVERVAKLPPLAKLAVKATED